MKEKLQQAIDLATDPVQKALLQEIYDLLYGSGGAQTQGNEGSNPPPGKDHPPQP